ncbi:MAG: type II secretion system F family protein, partial [Pseudomonadota bacterium]
MKYARKSYGRNRRNPRSYRAKTADILKRKQYFDALATGLGAGMTASESLKTLLDDGELSNKSKLSLAIRALENGSAVSQAFQKYLNITDIEVALIEVAESSGGLAKSSRAVAEHHGRTVERARKLKVRLILPALVGIFAIFFLPLPKIISGDLSISTYATYVLAIGIAIFVFG